MAGTPSEPTSGADHLWLLDLIVQDVVSALFERKDLRPQAVPGHRRKMLLLGVSRIMEASLLRNVD